MENIFILLLACTLMALGTSGTCPRYPLIVDFDFQKYLGLWYQQDKKQASWEIPGRCWKSVYLRDPQNGQFKMRMIFENTITNREEKYDSQLSLQGPERPSFIKYTIPLTFLENEFQVLATDYKTFSVEYKCDPNGILEKQESVFLLTRDKNPEPSVLQKAYAIMHRYGIDIRKLERVDQTCGGFMGAPNAPTYTYVNYDYFQSPGQGIENKQDYLSESESERYDYFDAPPIRMVAPVASSLIQERRPAYRRRYWRPNFNIFG